MTRDERAAISILNAYKEGYESAIEDYKKEPTDENLHKEREQAYMQGYEDTSKRFRLGPCTDAVSRQAVIEILGNYGCTNREGLIFKDIRALPPVTQKSDEQLYINWFADGYEQGHKDAEQKSGKWINDKNDMPICSRCGYIPQYDRAIDDYEYSNYCPSCGCRMVEPQESESDV